MNHDDRTAEAEALLDFIESLPEDDEIRRFLENWRAYRAAHGAVLGSEKPF